MINIISVYYIRFENKHIRQNKTLIFRPNITLIVEDAASERYEEKLKWLLDSCQRHVGLDTMPKVLIFCRCEKNIIEKNPQNLRNLFNRKADALEGNILKYIH